MNDRNQTIALGIIKKLSGQKNVLTIPRLYIDLMGNLHGALFLSQILYWSDRGSNPDGWIYKTYQQWTDEICLSTYDVKKAAKFCIELGFLETKIKKANGSPTVHYRLKVEKFFEWLVESSSPKTKNLTFQNENFNNGKENISLSITETTAETTTELADEEKISSADVHLDDVFGPPPRRQQLSKTPNGAKIDLTGADPIEIAMKLGGTKHAPGLDRIYADAQYKLQRSEIKAGHPDTTDAFVHFLAATGYEAPYSADVSDWIKTLREHVDRFGTNQLYDFYKWVVDNKDYSLTRPGAFTKGMTQRAQELDKKPHRNEPKYVDSQLARS